MAVNESAFAPTSSNLRPGRDFSEEERNIIVEEYNDMQLMHSPAFLCEKYNTDIAFIRNLLKSSRRPARHFSDEEKKIIAEEYDVHSSKLLSQQNFLSALSRQCSYSAEENIGTGNEYYPCFRERNRF